MQAGTVDKCLLHRMVDGVCGVTALQVDDSFGRGNDAFLKLDE